jgi:predicted enzyme related to lactoylglutathione lyase
MPNPVVHFEIISKHATAALGFYNELFGWNADADNEFHYGIVQKQADEGIGGGIGGLFDGEQSFVTFYVQVDDLQATLDKAEAMGAKTVMPPMEVPGGPTMAQFVDPEGHRIGLVKSGPGQP